MEQKFGYNSLDVQVLRDFCKQEGSTVQYRKGEKMEYEGEPSQWFGFVEEGCFKYVTRGISDGKEHITWFSFEGEFVGNYPCCLNGTTALTTIEAMIPSRVLRISGEQMQQLFHQNMEMMELRGIISEHLLSQCRARYLDLHRATPRERYELLLRRCPGIVQHLPLNSISSFLCITPQMLSKIRKSITFNIQT
jgi:CRP-like cAMP-binding protein